MELVLKTYSNQFSETITNQIQNIEKAVLNFDINNFGVAEIKIPVIEGLERYNKIELYEVEDIDTLVFAGYIFDLRVKLEEIVLICRGTKELMNYKLLTSDKSYSSKTITFIMNDLLSVWNSAYGESWTFFCNDTTNITKDFKIGDNFFDILDELSGLLGLVWEIEGTRIVVREFIGTDRTSGVNFKELIFMGNSPSVSNISEPELTSYPTLRNVIIGVDKNGKQTKTDATSITNYGPLAELKNFRDGNLAEQTQEFLDSRKNEQKIFNFDIYDYNNIGAGDKVKLTIEKANSYLDFSGSAIVNTQKVEYINRDKIVSLGVSDIYVYRDTIQNRLRQLDKNLKLLTI